MKKIGVLTWHYGANYGAKAQSYALQQTIKSLGYDVFMINYRTKGYRKLNYETNTEIKNKWLHPIRVLNGIKRCSNFSNVERLYNETGRVTGYEDINRLGFDAIVLGSDAIFNVLHPLYNDIYYGVGINACKILYSPSCEYLSPDFELSDGCKKSLREMKGYAVRDLNTKKLIFNNIGVESRITLDPTFLYSFDDIKYDLKVDNYILVYSFNDLGEYSKSIVKFAKNNNLQIVSVGKEYRWANISYSDASFELWIESFRHARYVVTDSFHGTVFAIKNSKDFVVCAHEGNVAKIASLLKELSINRLFYDGNINIEDYLGTGIDYENVSNKLTNMVLNSRNYLENALIKSVKEGNDQ